MKKLYVLFLLLLASQTFATVSLWNADRSRVIINIKGTETLFTVYDSGPGTFHKKNFGIFDSGDDVFTIAKYSCNISKSSPSTDNVNLVMFYYEIYPLLDGPSGAYKSVVCHNLNNTSLGAGNEEWGFDAASINLLEGLEKDVQYGIQIYCMIIANNYSQTLFDNNGGSNYRAGFTSSSTFPVELTSFNAVPLRNSVKLTWETATEVNNFGFEVERLGEMGSWQKIAEVQGAGTSNSPKEYSFIDKTPLGGSVLQYRLKQIDNDGIFKYYDPIAVNVTAPSECKLLPNFPNPFNPSTSIRFQLSKKSFVTLKIYDALGREVATILNEQKSAGTFSATWNGRNSNGILVPSGIYYCRITADNFSETRKMSLMK